MSTERTEKRGERMNIYEAAKKALEEGKCIRERPYNVKIKLANGTTGTMMRLDGCHPVKGWQPTARELISDSWEVME